jgi:hypothetical protein
MYEYIHMYLGMYLHITCICMCVLYVHTCINVLTSTYFIAGTLPPLSVYYDLSDVSSWDVSCDILVV